MDRPEDGDQEEGAEYPELWAFLKSLNPGDLLTGTVAAIERFGVFVALDDGPPHPVFPGVGFISAPNLSWRHVEAFSDVVQVGEQITCSFICMDDGNGEARISLKDLQPDPWQEFLAAHVDGRPYDGRVTKVVPSGVFVWIADGVEGLLLDRSHEVGDRLTVWAARMEPDRRRLFLIREATPTTVGRVGQELKEPPQTG
ncbi:S1 RNA-binding domain-containing protein [Herbidospora sp. RD11066]